MCISGGRARMRVSVLFSSVLVSLLFSVTFTDFVFCCRIVSVGVRKLSFGRDLGVELFLVLCVFIFQFQLNLIVLIVYFCVYENEKLMILHIFFVWKKVFLFFVVLWKLSFNFIFVKARDALWEM